MDKRCKYCKSITETTMSYYEYKLEDLKEGQQLFGTIIEYNCKLLNFKEITSPYLMVCNKFTKAY